MRVLVHLILVLAVLAVIAGAVFFSLWDMPPPTQAVEQTIPHPHLHGTPAESSAAGTTAHSPPASATP